MNTENDTTVQPRDSQRSRVYKAERSGGVVEGWYMPKVEEVRGYIARLQRQPGYQERWGGRKPITVHDGRRRRDAAGCPIERAVWLPRWSRYPLVICHEIAHVETPDEAPAHGEEFCGNFLFLVRLTLGRDGESALRESFDEHRVKYLV